MHFHLILLLLVSVMLVVMSSWNLNVFIRLGNASNDYPNDQNFEDSCHVSKTYTEGGKVMAIVMVIVSALILLASCVTVYKQK
jgi:hypothetical protein